MKQFKLFYQIRENEEKIKLFGDDFFMFHANQYKMIMNDNKISTLKKEYSPKEPNKNLKVKLIIFNNYCLNLRKMFEKSSLMKFSITSPINNNLENELKKDLNNDSNNKVITGNIDNIGNDNINEDIKDHFENTIPDNEQEKNILENFYKKDNFTVTIKNEKTIKPDYPLNKKHFCHIFLFSKEKISPSDKD